jgi:hypothetical protein
MAIAQKVYICNRFGFKSTIYNLKESECVVVQLWVSKVVKTKNGPLAEWLGKALQKLLQQFESARDLKKGSFYILE